MKTHEIARVLAHLLGRGDRRCKRCEAASLRPQLVHCERLSCPRTSKIRGRGCDNCLQLLRRRPTIAMGDDQNGSQSAAAI